jgi:hypothetical protein
MENKVLKIVFTIFIGVMVALFVGFGIEAFYPAPPYPNDLGITYAKEMTEAQQATAQALQTAYDEAVKLHNQITSIVVTAVAVIIMFVSMFLEKRNITLTNGLLLGGLFTLIYGSGVGFTAGSAMITFITVGVGLASVIVVGVRRFNPAREARQAAKP